MENNSGRTILVVDDERMLRRTLGRVLGRAGFTVLLAEDGEEAVEVFSKNMQDIDLVILDMNMPKMDGIAAFAQLRKLSPQIHILLASGESEEEVLSRFHDEHPNGVLKKPFVLSYLLNKVRDVMN